MPWTLKGLSESGTWHTALYRDTKKVAHGTRHFIEIPRKWDLGLYKDVKKIFFFIVITATRRLKRHTPCKTNRQKNGRETVLLSFRGKQGRHKADLPCSPLLDDYKRPTYYNSKVPLYFN